MTNIKFNSWYKFTFQWSFCFLNAGYELPHSVTNWNMAPVIESTILLRYIVSIKPASSLLYYTAWHSLSMSFSSQLLSVPRWITTSSISSSARAFPAHFLSPICSRNWWCVWTHYFSSDKHSMTSTFYRVYLENTILIILKSSIKSDKVKVTVILEGV